MSVDEYIDLITSPEPIDMSELTQLDRKGVAEGKVYAGMTTKGVLTALGYPATHRTPSLKYPRWIYWTSKFGGTVAVDFDKNGLVLGVRN